MTLEDLNAALRAVRAEMRAKGIRRLSCFNGGHSPDSYRLNAEMFRLETLKAQQARTDTKGSNHER